MRVLLIFGVLISALQQPWPASAEAVPEIDKGNGLLELCEMQDSFADGTCLGYVRGAAKVFNGLGQICYPDGATAQQLVDVVKKGLKDHPEERQRDSALLIRKYASAAFPCAKAK